MRRGRTMGGAVLVLLGLVLAGGQLVLPRLCATLIAGRVGREAQASFASAEVHSFPAWRLLGGQVDAFHLDLRDARFGKLAVSGFLIDASNVVLNFGELIRGRLQVSSTGSLRATLLLTEANLNHYLWATADPGHTFRIHLAADRAAADGRISLFGVPLDLHLKGRFIIEPPAVLRFAPEEFAVERMPVPRVVLDSLLSKTFAVPLKLEDLPVAVTLSGVRIERGRLFLFAKGVH